MVAGARSPLRTQRRQRALTGSGVVVTSHQRLDVSYVPVLINRLPRRHEKDEQQRKPDVERKHGD